MEKKSNMILCQSCGNPIHITDLGMIKKEGMWHKECCLRDSCEVAGFLIYSSEKVKSTSEVEA